MFGAIDGLFDGATVRRLTVGQMLFQTGEPVRHLFRVRAGQICLLRRTDQGNSLVLRRAGPGDALAEASLWSPRYHCDSQATEATEVEQSPVALVRARLAADPALAEGWARVLALAVQNARLRAGILSLRTVSERLDAWLANGNRLPVARRMQTLATELGISREALYRELSLRRSRAGLPDPPQNR